MKNVILYTESNNVYCVTTKMFLNSKKIKYEERNITDHSGYALEAESYGIIGTPLVVPSPEYNIHPWGGYIPEKLAELTK